MQGRPIPYDRAVKSRLPLAAWYLLIAGLAWWGWSVNMHDVLVDMVYFSNVTILTVAVVYSALTVATLRGDRGGGLIGTVARGACAMYAVIVAIIFNTLLDADLSYLSSLLEHAVVPALVVIDWLLVRRREPRLRGRVLLAWMVIPMLYIPLYTFNDRPGEPGVPIYGFLDPAASNYWPMLCAFAGFFVIVGAGVWALRTVTPRRSPAAEPYDLRRSS